MPAKPATSDDKPKMAYRYACPACTGIACYASMPVNEGSTVCSNCGKRIVYARANWIALTPEESAKVNKV